MPDKTFIEVASPVMSEAELLTRAREAYISAHKPWRFIRRRVRAGFCDHRLRPIMHALHDLARPMGLIVADRDEATAALIMKSTPGLPQERAVADAILTAIRVGRRG